MAEQIRVHNKSELGKYRKIIQDNLDKCVIQLKELLQGRNSVEIFQILKFEKSVTEPLSGKTENLIEVINQSMTYLVSIIAVEYLYDIHTEQTYIINWGNIAGYDIESVDGTIVCECFAATSYSSNGKLSKDLKRLSQNDIAIYKYEFFYDKEFKESQRSFYEEKYPGIQIVKFSDIQ